MLELNTIVKLYFDIINKYSISFNKDLVFKFNDILNIDFAYIKGLNLIKNILNINLLYLDDIIDISISTEKIFIYYIEFLNQIYSNKYIENFELSIKDALIFCYKKFSSNFDIISEKKEISKNELEKLNCYINIINIVYILTNCNYEYQLCYDLNDEKEKDLFLKKNNNLINKWQKILGMIFIKKEVELKEEYLDNIFIFFNNIYNEISYNYLNKLEKKDKIKFYINLYNIIDKFICKKQYILELKKYNLQDILNNDLN